MGLSEIFHTDFYIIDFLLDYTTYYANKCLIETMTFIMWRGNLVEKMSTRKIYQITYMLGTLQLKCMTDNYD